MQRPVSTHRSRSLMIVTIATTLTLAVTGCGNNIGDLLFSSATAAGNTAFDLLLTGFANQVADSLNPPPPEEDDGLPDGDAAAGMQAFTAGGCAVCHGADAQGGSAPQLAGSNHLEDLEARFGDGGIHYSRMLSEEEIVDLATWLLTLEAGGGGEPVEGDPVAGEQKFADSGCNACHGDGAEGGSGPTLAGMDKTDALETRFGGGGSHFGKSLSAQDIADVASWLEGL